MNAVSKQVRRIKRYYFTQQTIPSCEGQTKKSNKYSFNEEQQRVLALSFFLWFIP